MSRSGSREVQLAKEIEKDVRTDIKAAKKIPRLPWWAVLCVMIGVMPIFLLFDHFDKSQLTLPTLSSVLVLILVLVLKWKLRGRVWFWITLAVIAGLHVLLLLFVPWTTKWVPAPEVAGLATIDLIVALAIVDVVGRLVEVA